MDNDDEIEPNYIKTLAEAIETKDADMIVCGHRRFNDDGKEISSMGLSEDLWSKFRMVSPWGRIVKKDFISENNLHFGKFLIGEDSFFSYAAYNASDKIYMIPYMGYH